MNGPTLRAIPELAAWRDEDLSPAGWYGGRPAVVCRDCGHVSPTPEHLRIHAVRHCCAPVRRAA